MKTNRPRFWWGPISSLPQAKRIIGVAGWVYVLFATLALLGNLSPVTGGPAAPGGRNLTPILVVGALGAVLLIFKSRVPALALFVLSGSFSALFLWLATRTEDAKTALYVVSTALVFLLLAILCWRAFRATLAIPRIKAATVAEALQAFE